MSVLSTLNLGDSKEVREAIQFLEQEIDVLEGELSARRSFTEAECAFEECEKDGSSLGVMLSLEVAKAHAEIAYGQHSTEVKVIQHLLSLL